VHDATRSSFICCRILCVLLGLLLFCTGALLAGCNPVDSTVHAANGHPNATHHHTITTISPPTPPHPLLLCRLLDQPESLLDLSGHTHWVWQVAYSPFHDPLLLSSSTDTTVCVWYTPTLAKNKGADVRAAATSKRCAVGTAHHSLCHLDAVMLILAAGSCGPSNILHCGSADV
jgi:WD40 repeat protein